MKDPLEKAWIAFWQDDSDKKKENKVALCQKGNSDHDYMGAVQAYLNLTRWDELTQEEEEKRKTVLLRAVDIVISASSWSDRCRLFGTREY